MKFPKKPKCYKCGGEVRFSSTRKDRKIAVVIYKCRECGITNSRRVHA